MKNCEREKGTKIADSNISNGYIYSSSVGYSDTIIDAKDIDSSLTFTLTVSDALSGKLNIEITTTVSRYKSK